MTVKATRGPGPQSAKPTAQSPPPTAHRRATIFSPVPRPHLSRGLAVGALAASATAGALAGFGIRLGTPARPFNAVARLVLGGRADGVWGFDPPVTAVGVLLHVTVMCVWGFLTVRLAQSRRGAGRVAVAVVVALLALAIDLLVVARVLRAGVSGVLAPVQVVVVHVVLAIALVVGMRLASPPT